MQHQASGPAAERDPILASLADERRRRTLAAVMDRSTPVSERDLATNLVADERELPPDDVSADEARSVRITLRHVHLPKLDAVDLVEWDRDAATAGATDHPALEDPKLRTVVATEADDWDAVVDSLAHGRRRLVLSVLRERIGAVALDDLVGAVRDLEGGADAASTTASVDAVRRSLYHVHLPKLDDAGLVSYDRDASGATFEGHPELDDSWLPPVRDEAIRTVASAVHPSEDA